VPKTREVDGKKVERLRREQQFYTPDLLGRVCVDGCGGRVPLALNEAGIWGHPTCGPLHRDLAARLAAAPT
jgi:hypothetical protein